MLPAAFITATLALSVGTMSPDSADIDLLCVGLVPWNAQDRSGLSDSISTPTGSMPHDQLGSFGSGLAYTGRDNLYVACPDRGPADGAAAYFCRVQFMRISLVPSEDGSEWSMRIECERTSLLRSARGEQFIGSAAAINPAEPARALRYDPEGIRVALDGSIIISDEYGPWVDRFSLDGRQLARIPSPPSLFNPIQSGEAGKELPPAARTGRQPNRGMEGLAITPEGSRLYGIMQSPLIQDSGLDASNKRIGRNARIIEFHLREGAAGPRRQFVYQLEEASHSLNEICAVSDRTFLVLERDGKAGAKAKFRSLYKIVLDGASDVSRVPSLPAHTLPQGIRPVQKTAFLDLMEPRFGLAGASMPEKIEGVTFGPDLPDGRRLLLVTTDNDFIEGNPSVIWAFAVDASLLPDFQSQLFEK